MKFRVDIPCFATAYIEAPDAKAALEKALDMSDTDLGVSPVYQGEIDELPIEMSEVAAIQTRGFNRDGFVLRALTVEDMEEVDED